MHARAVSRSPIFLRPENGNFHVLERKGQGPLNETEADPFISINEERSEWKEFCPSRSFIRKKMIPS